MAGFKKPVIVVQIEAKVVWQGARDPQTGTWIGVCHLLNLNAIGDTWIELQQCAAEALGLLLQDLFEDGELEEFLRINGWTLQTPLPAPGTRGLRFDVPFSLDRISPTELLAVGA